MLPPQNPTPRPPLTTLICDCNQTQRLDPQAMGRALTDPLQTHTLLCRREAGVFLQALQSGEPLTVACTQERALFEQLATESAQAQSRAWAPIKFVNIRETAGWSDQGPMAVKHLPARTPLWRRGSRSHRPRRCHRPGRPSRPRSSRPGN